MKLLAATLAFLTLLAAPAAATVYKGTHGARGTLSFELSDDGKRVVAYKIDQARGDTCELVAAGDKGVWAGATLSSSGGFSWNLADVIELDGDFDGRTGTGTLRLRRHAGPNHEACDSGKVCWSVAAAGATAPPLCPGSSPTPSPDPTPAPSAPGTTPETRRSEPTRAPKLYRSSVSVRRAARTLTGKVTSSSKTCRGGRTVLLRRGSKIVGRAKTKADGRFSFRRTGSTRGRTLRVQVPQRQVSATLCASVLSKTFRG